MPSNFDNMEPLPSDLTDDEIAGAERLLAEEKFLTEDFRPLDRRKQKQNTASAVGDATERHLRLLQAEHRRFLGVNSPVKASLWLALLRPAADVIADYQATLGLANAAAPTDDPDEARPPAQSKPAIIALGEALVAKGLLGDVSAFSQISDRIEGKVGLRKGDDDGEQEARRGEIQAAVSGTIEALTDAARKAKERDAPVTIEGHATTVSDDPVAAAKRLTEQLEKLKNKPR